MLKPLVYFDQDDIQTHYRNDELYLHQILVCPILEPNSLVDVYVCTRGNWFNYWTNKSVKGGKEMWVDTHFDEIPVL
jgi:alpha-glucosidase